MSRRVSSDAAAQAAAEASQAARVLANRGAELKRSSEPLPPATPPKADSEPAKKSERRREAPPDEKTNDRVNELRKNNPNDKLRDEFFEKQMERYGSKPDEEPAPEKKEEEPAPAKAEEPAAQPAEAQPEAPPAPEAPKTVRVKVDGEEFDAPAEEIDAYGGVRAYQIAKAQENRLKKINEALAELKASQKPAAPTTPEKPKESDQQFIASKMDVVRFGSPEESAAAWLEIQQRLQPKPLDTNAIIEAATNRIKHDQAVAQFDKEFPEIAANPLLVKLADSLRRERFGELKGPVDWGNFYRKIGNEIRSVLPQRQSQPQTATQPTPGTPSQPSDKEARKASITNLPAASARAEPPKEEKQPTREDVLDEMKKSRMVWRG